MTIQTRRDPKIGKAWLAYYALAEGDEPFECLGDYLRDAIPMLQAHMQRDDVFVPSKDEEKLSGLLLVLLGLAETLDGGDSPFKLELRRRRRGRPTDRLDMAHKGNRVAVVVKRRLAAGDPMEAAVAQAMQETGLSRSEVFAWVRRNRRREEMIDRLLTKSGQKPE